MKIELKSPFLVKKTRGVGEIWERETKKGEISKEIVYLCE